jgi:hypothetical protein
MRANSTSASLNASASAASAMLLNVPRRQRHAAQP